MIYLQIYRIIQYIRYISNKKGTNVMIKALEEDRIGWKSILDMRLSKEHKILYIKARLIKLLIPKGTTCNITFDKCRAEKFIF